MSNHPSSNSKHFAIVLAAGASNRMGTCKTTLPWLNGHTLLSYQIEQLLRADMTPVVVLSPHNSIQQKRNSSNGQVVINLHSETGKVSSILAGLRQIPEDFGSLTIVAVDQPRPYWVYQTLLENHLTTNAPITVPTYQGRMGHPVIFSQSVWSSLWQLREETLGLRQIIREFDQQIQRVEFATSDVLLDLNTPDRYRSAFLALHQADGKVSSHTTDGKANP